MSETTFTFNVEPFISTSIDTNLTSASYGNRKDELIDVDIGTSCTSIGDNCFFDCSSLNSVTISSEVTSLGASCFEQSTLTSISIPNNVTSLGTKCFNNCVQLTSVTLSNNLTLLPNFCLSSTGITTITIPNSVTSLGNNCFENCVDFTSITVPDTVTSLGISCFNACYNLSSITLSNNLTSLPENCLSDTGITTITIPNNVTSLGESCFATSTQLTTIYIPTNVTNIGFQCFLFCQALTSVIYENPSIITSVDSQVYLFTPQMNVKFYNTSSAPNPPLSQSGVYDTSIYTSGSTFNYFSGASCYNEGTLILCLKDELEQYIKIEDLRKNDLVKTYLHGYKKIKLIGKNQIINNPTNDLKCMYEYDDLICTGGHSILVDELTNEEKEKMNKYNFSEIIDDKKLLLACSSDKFKKITNKKEYTIYHMVLEGDNKQYGIYVNNGILSETTDENFFLKNNFIQL